MGTIRLSWSRALRFLLSLGAGYVLALHLPLPAMVRAESAPPLPPDLKIEAPGPEVPQEYRDFLGLWEGEWKNRLAYRRVDSIPLILVVEKVDAQKARVVFSLGQDPNQRLHRGWRRQEINFSRREGRLELPVAYSDRPLWITEEAIKFFINDKGNLEGRLMGWQFVADIELRRRPEALASMTQESKVKEGLASQKAQEVPLPEDIRLEKPDESLPPEVKRLVGVWAGEWILPATTPGFSTQTRQKSVLIVEKVQHQSAQVVFAWADCLEWRTPKGWRRYGASILKVDQKIELSFAHFSTAQDRSPPRRNYTFFINDKGKLEGKHTANLNAYIEMEKKEHFAVAALPQDLKAAKVETGPPGPGPDQARLAVAHRKQALALAQKGDYAQALAELDQALALNPQDAAAHTRRGGIHTLQGQYDQAISDFNRALELDPRYAKAYYNRALAYHYQGRYDQAISDLNKTIELKPKDAEAYHNRGLAYNQKRDYDKALDDFNLAIALNPRLAEAYFHKAATCDLAGRRDEAQEAYAAYLKVAPPEAKAQIEQARSRIGQR